MKLQTRINLFSLTILFTLTMGLVLIGALVINDIVYDLNRRLLVLEIEDELQKIEKGYAVLVRSGVTGVETYENRMKAERIEAVRRADFGPTGRLSIVTLDGEVVHHRGMEGGGGLRIPYLERMVAQKAGTLIFEEAGERRFGVFRTFEPWRWVMVLSVAESEMFEKRAQYLGQVSVMGLIMVLVTLLFSSFLTRRIIRRIRDALACADRVKNGDLTARIDPIPVDDEIGSLQENINAMIARIEERTLENRKTRQELRESKEKYQGYIENAPEMVFVFDEGGRFLEVNAAAAAATGHTRTALLEMGLTDLFRWEGEGAAPWVDDGSREGGCPGDEIRVRRKDGGTFYALMEAVRLSENRYLGFCRDITRRKNLEAALQQAHKMEALGTLAGGVAHDINNILGIILGNAELAMDVVSPDHPASRNLEEVYRACLRGRDVVRRILSYSRRTDRQVTPLRVVPILEAALKMLRSSAPASIAFETAFPAGSDGVMADAAALHQVFMNLFSNAIQAMGRDGGVLTVTLESITLTPTDADRNGGPGPGDYLRLTVADTGEGIEPGVAERIFDPYFTTKPVGEGSGMGLSIVHGIVRDYGGTVTVQSTPGEGTRFAVFLPVTEVPDAPPAPEVSPVQRGTGRILLVDDEGAVVELGQQMLGRLGYCAEASQDPLEALSRFREGPDRFDLVITDMTMPNLQGTALVDALRAIRSDIPIILCTGYSDIMTRTDAAGLAVQGVLIKPYRSRELAAAIQEALAAFGGNRPAGPPDHPADSASVR